MQESSYQKLIERMAECEDLAKTANDPSVKEKAAELVRGYRDLIASADRLGALRAGYEPAWAIVERPGICAAATRKEQ